MRIPADRQANDRTTLLLVVFLFTVIIYCAPLILGRARMRFRDLGTTQVPAAALQKQHGISTLDLHASFGQPFAGNPNLLVHYRAPMTWMSTEQHLLLHWALGLAGMFFFLRTLALPRDAAALGAISFSCSGYVLSSLAFLNATTTIGILPWVLWAAVSDRPRVVAVSLLCALMALLSLSGEPALIVLGSLLALSVAARRSLRHAGRIVAGAAGGLLLTLPFHYATWLAARDSARVVRGFTFEAAAVHSLHPMRLLEWLLPRIFGSPSALLSGAWWGFRFSDNRLPYIFSLAILCIPLLFLLLQAITAWRLVDRFWSAVFAVALVASAFGHLPFARALYALLGRGMLRYPIKFFLLVTLAASVLGAQAFAYWTSAAPAASRQKAKRVAAAAAVILAIAALAAAVMPERVAGTMQRAWDGRWRSDPAVVLAPIVAWIPTRLLFVSIMAAAAAWTVAKPGPKRLTIAGLLVVLDAVLLAPPLVPRVSAPRLEVRSPLLAAAAALPGPVCELTVKDLEPVRRGLQGHYGEDAAGELAVVQMRQAWATSGAPYGIRYAYNDSPDGSYTYRNQLVQDAIEQHGTWDYVLRWLRASGVSGLISPPVNRRWGLQEIAREDSMGVPAVLYRIPDTLPSVRRSGHVVWASSPREALDAFGRSTFDPAIQLVVEGSPRPLAAGGGSATIVQHGPDRLAIRSNGAGPQLLFVARSFTSTATATVNGALVPVLPANVHLIAVPVPAGESTISIQF